VATKTFSHFSGVCEWIPGRFQFPPSEAPRLTRNSKRRQPNATSHLNPPCSNHQQTTARSHQSNRRMPRLCGASIPTVQKQNKPPPSLPPSSPGAPKSRPAPGCQTLLRSHPNPTPRSQGSSKAPSLSFSRIANRPIQHHTNTPQHSQPALEGRHTSSRPSSNKQRHPPHLSVCIQGPSEKLLQSHSISVQLPTPTPGRGRIRPDLFNASTCHNTNAQLTEPHLPRNAVAPNHPPMRQNGPDTSNQPEIYLRDGGSHPRNALPTSGSMVPKGLRLKATLPSL
jgi:hypothetical protein